ncbi:MAG TPA: NADH-ubiquinone oxidoreductase-F iron-sulfur binding region domain-containing protein [Anaerolineales bacterium]|nr:NADH-ubiquinone oxidoreductase-F iron-sulfur binding region domain-containing protein [Anaerolineales bacterium]
MQRNTITHQAIDPGIAEYAERHQHNPEYVLAVLQGIQAERGELRQEAIGQVARAMRLPFSLVYGVATFYSMLAAPVRAIRVCDGPACWLRGAAYLRAALEAEAGDATIAGEEGNINGAGVRQVQRSSCLGLCDRAPAALVGELQVGPVSLQHVGELALGWQGEPIRYTQPLPGEVRVLLAGGGEIDPDSIASALAHGAYQGFGLALKQSSMWVIEEVEAAGLRGRGGAGFPTGRKLRLVAEAAEMERFIVCNADESEPLVFKDRVIIDTNPHKVLEGMALAAYATGARTGFIYIRGEYAGQAQRLETAIRQAEAHGWLGDHIQGTDFSFHIHVHCGAGAYICGEETALLESLEGRRGEPRIRPPFPAASGYHGQPTVVNNVETFATLPGIVANGSDWYRAIGSPQTPGTKLYTLLGHINRPGLFEAPYGLTLRQIIEEFGGGMQPGSEFHFALTGGAAGTLVPVDLIDTPIDYSSTSKGISLGAGAFLVCDQTVSPVVLLREVMFFFESESCGKCTPCRLGTQQARQTLDRIIAGKGTVQDGRRLAELADLLQNTSFCGLGQSAAMPIKSTMKHFEQYFYDRI